MSWILAFTASGLLTDALVVSLLMPWVDHTGDNPFGMPVMTACMVLLFGYLALMVGFRFGLGDRSPRARVYRGLLVFFPLWILPVLLILGKGLGWLMERR